MKNITRVSQKQVEELEIRISERDREILQSLQKCRYMSTRQIATLHFNNSATPKASLRASSRGLAKLRDYGLIGALRRRIGGNLGSGSYVWALTDAGFRLLNLRNNGDMPRKHFREPTPLFLEHMLTVAEAYVQLAEICRKNNMTLVGVQLEPTCWRWYKGRGGKQQSLKPDLYAVTQSGGYEDSWFLEIDLDTETVYRIIDKCDRYVEYMRTEAEQKKNGVFPYVVWIVPTEKRKASIQHHINDQHPKAPDIFVVITPDEFERLITVGASNYKAKEGGM